MCLIIIRNDLRSCLFLFVMPEWTPLKKNNQTNAKISEIRLELYGWFTIHIRDTEIPVKYLSYLVKRWTTSIII